MKKLILLLLFVIASTCGTAQSPLLNFKNQSILYSTTDSLVYLTKLGAVNVLNTYSNFYFCNQIGKQKDSIINLLNNRILIYTIENMSIKEQSKVLQEIAKTQKKQIFWAKVEIWGYRVAIGTGLFFMIFR